VILPFLPASAAVGGGRGEKRRGGAHHPCPT
jgi:hypothetical protein